MEPSCTPLSPVTAILHALVMKQVWIFGDSSMNFHVFVSMHLESQVFLKTAEKIISKLNSS
jgi:hypothetical protein